MTRGELREDLCRRLPPTERGKEEEVSIYRQFLDEHQERIRRDFLRSPRGIETAEQQAALFDTLLTTMFDRAQARALRRHPSSNGEGEAALAMVAVGGYGRRQLSPFSDVDIVFIPSREAHPAVDEVVREVFSLLTETLLPLHHPRISHSYRPPTDIPLLDHQSLTALLEARFLAGDLSLFHGFMEVLLEHVHQADFILGLWRERWLQHRELHSGVHLVEPNVKESPGGLRDFHSAIWLAKTAFQIRHWDVLEELMRLGHLQPQERQALIEALEFLLRLRHALHWEKGQKQDVLFVQYQGPLAQFLGYPSEELLMEDYYRHAERLHAFFYQVVRWCDEIALPVDPGVFVRYRHVWVEGPAFLREAPHRMVKAFAVAQRYGLHIAPSAERWIQEVTREVGGRILEDAEAAPYFLRILGGEGDVSGTLEHMLRLGLLEHLLPEFAPLMRLVPFDPAHEFTVGEHSLRVVRVLQEIRDHPDADTQWLSSLMRSLQEPHLLVLAALLHDAGKAERGRDHTEAGVEIAQEVCRRLGVFGEQRDLVVFLVREHLLMSRTSRLRSLALPETIERFLSHIPNALALDMLYLLTYADNSAVGPNVLRDVEKRLLQELYELAKMEFLSREQEALGLPRKARLEQALRWVERELSLSQLPQEEVRQHLQAMPTNYVLNTPPEEIALHIRCIARLPEEKVVVSYRTPKRANYTEVVVCLYDRPGVLRDIAGALALNNVDIYLAQLDNRLTEPRISITTLWVDDHGQPVTERRLSQMVEDLRAVLLQEKSVEELLRQRRSGLGERVRLDSVEVRNDLSRSHTVIQFRAQDQVGLLYLLCRAITSLNLDIFTAKVTTWRGMAEDAFYVTDLQGRKLPDEACEELEQQLRARLEMAPQREAVA